MLRTRTTHTLTKPVRGAHCILCGERRGLVHQTLLCRKCVRDGILGSGYRET